MKKKKFGSINGNKHKKKLCYVRKKKEMYEE